MGACFSCKRNKIAPNLYAHKKIQLYSHPDGSIYAIDKNGHGIKIFSKEEFLGKTIIENIATTYENNELTVNTITSI